MFTYRLVFISLSVFVLGCNAPTTQPVEQKPAAPTAQAVADRAQEAAPSAAQGCEVGQNITVKLTSAAQAGQGCQQGGGIAQKDSTHVFEIIANAQGEKSAKQIQPKSDGATQIINQLKIAATENGCTLKGNREMHINMPIDNETQGQAQFNYVYDVASVGGSVTGTGNVTYKFVKLEGGEVMKPACTEPLRIGQ
jgi:hypothetical protein